MECARDVVQGLAFDNGLRGGINDRDLRLRLAAECAGIGIHVRAVNKFAIRGQRQIAGASSGQKALGFLAGFEIDHGDVVAEAVGDVESVGSGVKDDPAGLEAGGQGSDDLQRGCVNDRHCIGPRVGDDRVSGVGRERNGAWHMPYGDGLDQFAGGGLDYSQLVAVLADYVEKAAIRGDRDLEGR